MPLHVCWNHQWTKSKSTLISGLLGNSSMYVITTSWKSIVKNNQLQVDNVVQL
ncbi:hypothetical protein Gotri_019720 [Gossypium trilobum]|uniref:Uncharacterized protein n=1 Tax=Gossypium trilobum TaxID=34281 RepID=A0A7J9EEG8_9ROSI|nr:hypothetical protein [Gossypium trilobum]